MTTEAATESSGRLVTETASLAKRLGRAPTASELAGAVGMNREEVLDILVLGIACPMPHTDKRVGSADGMTCLGQFGAGNANLDRNRDRDLLQPLLAALPEGEGTVVVLRLFAHLTHTKIADLLGIPATQVSMLLVKALRQLRDQL